MHLIGIDLGGTKIEGVLLDADRPVDPLRRLRRPTGAEYGYEHILDGIVALVEELGKTSDVIGIGTPGTLDPRSRCLRGSNTQCLNGRPIQSDLEARLGVRVEIANDANCFALAEATLGAARGYDTVFGIILGTGVGGAFVVDGRVLSGCHGIAGEWGQIVVEPGGAESAHGSRGTVEAYLAGPSLEKFHAATTGREWPLEKIAGAAESDPAARATMDRLEEYFVRSLAMVIDTFDPEAIVIGGGVGNIDRLYTPELRARLGEAIFAPSFEAALLRPELGDSAGVFGAALLARR